MHVTYLCGYTHKALPSDKMQLQRACLLSFPR